MSETIGDTSRSTNGSASKPEWPALRDNPIVSLLGPRQAGKTTLAKMVASKSKKPVHFFDLESRADLARLSNPELVLRPLTGLVVLDEVQRRPDLFPLLRVLADRKSTPARFLILGSASPDLRVRVSVINQLGIQTPAATLRRFWTMVAHSHGQILNLAELARALGSSEPTARRYLDILSGTYVVRQLPPWFENLKKRQVKAPRSTSGTQGSCTRCSASRTPRVLTRIPS